MLLRRATNEVLRRRISVFRALGHLRAEGRSQYVRGRRFASRPATLAGSFAAGFILAFYRPSLKPVRLVLGMGVMLYRSRMLLQYVISKIKSE